MIFQHSLGNAIGTTSHLEKPLDRSCTPIQSQLMAEINLLKGAVMDKLYLRLLENTREMTSQILATCPDPIKPDSISHILCLFNF
jgi:hypothetical protein